MQKKQVRYIIRGMSQDLDNSKFSKKDFSFENYNIRITNNNDESLMSITNELGNIKESTVDGIIIGVQEIGNKVVIFTTDNRDKPTEELCIDSNNSTDMIYLFSPLDEEKLQIIYKGSLNFSTYNPIESIYNIETEHVKKVYWVDGINPLKAINIEHPNIREGKVLEDKHIDNNTHLELQDSINVEVIHNTSGLFPSGTVEYCFSYFNYFGVETPIINSSNINYITFKDRAGKKDEFVNNSYKVIIDNIDTTYEYVRLYSIVYSIDSSVPICSIVKDLNIKENIKNNSIVTVDTNTNNTAFDYKKLIFLGYKIGIPNTICTKDNTIFLGNNKQEFLSDFKDIIHNSEYIGRELNYEKNHITKSNSEYTFIKDENYCFAYQLQDSLGNWSNIQPIDTPKENNYNYFDLKVTLNHIPCKYKAARLLAYFPKQGERSIESFGVVVPTIYNTKDRGEKVPYSQPSYILRPNVIVSNGEMLNNTQDSSYVEFRDNFILPTTGVNTEIANIQLDNILPRYYDKDLFTSLLDKYASNFWIVDRNITNTYSEDIINSGSINTDCRMELVGISYSNKKDGYLDYKGSIKNTFPNIVTDSNMLGFNLLKVFKYGHNKASLCPNSYIGGFGLKKRIIHGTYTALGISYLPLFNTKGYMKDITDKELCDTYDSKRYYSVHECNAPIYFNDKVSINTKSLLIDKDTEASYIEVGANKYLYNNNIDKIQNPFNVVSKDFSFKLNRKCNNLLYNNINDIKSIGRKDFNMEYSTSYEEILNSKPVSIKYKNNTHIVSVLDNYKLPETREVQQIVDTPTGKPLNQNTDAILKEGKKDLTYSDLHIEGDTLKNHEIEYEFAIKTEFKNYYKFKVLHSINSTAYESSERFLSNTVEGILNTCRNTLDTQLPTFKKYIIECFKQYYSKKESESILKGWITTLESNKVETIQEIRGIQETLDRFHKEVINKDQESFDEFIQKTPFGGWIMNYITDVCIDRLIVMYNQILLNIGMYYNNESISNIPINTLSSLPEYYNTNEYETYFLINRIINTNSNTIDLKNIDYNIVSDKKYIHKGSVSLLTNRGDFHLVDNIINISNNNDGINNLNTFIKVPLPTRSLCNYNDNNSYSDSYSNWFVDNTCKTNNIDRKSFFSYKNIDEKLFDNNVFENTIYYSLPKYNGSKIDEWFNISGSTNYTIDGNKGTLNKLININNQLLFFQDRGFGQILYNERVQIQPSDNVPIEIASSQKMQGHRYLSDEVGCQNKWSICKSELGVYFVDNTDSILYLFSNQLKPLSKVLGFDEFFKNNNTHSIWNLENKNNWKIDYDTTNKGIYITNKNYSLYYSEFLQTFESFFNYNNVAFFFNIENDLYSSIDNLIYKQRVDTKTRCNFFGKQYPFSIKYNVLPEGYLDRIFTNLEFRADKFINSKMQQDIDLVMLLSDTDYQKGTIYDFKDKKFQRHLKRRFRRWGMQLPREDKTINRLRGYWCNVKLIFEGKYEHILHDMTVDYFEN